MRGANCGEGDGDERSQRSNARNDFIGQPLARSSVRIASRRLGPYSSLETGSRITGYKRTRVICRQPPINDSLFDNNCDVRAINTHFRGFMLNTRYFCVLCLVLSFHLPFWRYGPHLLLRPLGDRTISKCFCSQTVRITLTGATIVRESPDDRLCDSNVVLRTNVSSRFARPTETDSLVHGVFIYAFARKTRRNAERSASNETRRGYAGERNEFQRNLFRRRNRTLITTRRKFNNRRHVIAPPNFRNLPKVCN